MTNDAQHRRHVLSLLPLDSKAIITHKHLARFHRLIVDALPNSELY